MTSRTDEMTYPTLELILDVVASWVKKYRDATGSRDELVHWNPAELARTARDLGVSPVELVRMAARGLHAADGLPRLLRDLGVDPETLSRDDPAMMRDMQRLCSACSHKRRCERELLAGTAADTYRHFCPNALSLEAVLAPA
jgi:hypothetical protein